MGTIYPIPIDGFEPESQQRMNLESVSQKHVNELEHLVKDLLAVMRKAKLQKEPLGENLRLFEQELGDVRRQRFDEANPEFDTYG